MIGIYCIENTLNHKKYIGKAVNIDARWRVHRCELRKGKHPNKHLQSAWNKYGENAFIFYVIREVPIEMLEKAEIAEIERQEATKKGYNITEGGEGQRGRKLTDDQRKHLSEINQGAKNPNYGLKRSAETKRKMSEAMRGLKRKPLSKAHKKAISQKLKGKKRPYFDKAVYHVEADRIYKSITEAARNTGFSISGISKVCKGQRNSIYNNHFEFMEEHS